MNIGPDQTEDQKGDVAKVIDPVIDPVFDQRLLHDNKEVFNNMELRVFGRYTFEKIETGTFYKFTFIWHTDTHTDRDFYTFIYLPEEDVKKVVERQEHQKKEKALGEQFLEAFKKLGKADEQSKLVISDQGVDLLAIIKNQKDCSSDLYDPHEPEPEPKEITKITSIDELEKYMDNERHCIIFKHESLSKFLENCTIEKVNIEENIENKKKENILNGIQEEENIEAEKFYKLSPPPGNPFKPKIIYAPIKDLGIRLKKLGGGSKQKTRKNHRKSNRRKSNRRR